MRLFFVLVSLLISAFALQVRAAEESLDLDKETAATPVATAVSHASMTNKFNLMGRVDLTTETSTPDRNKDRTNHLDNNHFLIFLKAKASEKVSFMGEIVKQSFYFVDYQAKPFVDFQFGKILVPFGDNRKFHHFYGGVQGYGAKGVMFPNIWAESGANLKWKLANSELDTYWVDSIEDDSLTTDPGLQTTVEPKDIQAVGLRWTTPVMSNVTAVLSGYRGEYQFGKAVELAGLDVYSDYGALSLSNLRFAFGVANAWMRKSPISGDFQKRGDYIELATNTWGPGESRFRYGTYIDNDKVKTQKDVHSINVGYMLPIDVLHLLIEYQWNYEAVNEIDNDVFRMMVSLDF